MRVYVELIFRSEEEHRKFIESISGCADGVDISEFSLRYPSANFVALTSILVNVLMLTLLLMLGLSM